jgi:hypothetical protein
MARCAEKEFPACSDHLDAWRPVQIHVEHYFGCMTPKQFLNGSMSQAMRAKPMSAMPPTVFSPGVLYS